MNLRHIPWFLPEINEIDKKNVVEVLDSNYVNDGEVTRTFEKKLQEFLGVKHCVAVTSCTAAITLVLIGLEIGHGDEVLVPDFTFIATANAVKLTGADVRLVDIEPKRFTIKTENLTKAITPKTKAIIPVDVNGRGSNYEVLDYFAKEYGLKIVCDSAEALGSKYRGKYLGNYGDAACFSFSPNKTITTGQGGMIATNNTDLYYRLRELKDQGRRYQGTGGDDLHPVLGYNFKLTNLQAALGLAQFERLEKRLNHSVKRDMLYRELLKSTRGVTLPTWEKLDGEVLQWADILAENRQTLEKKFQETNIEYRNFWHPLHTQKPYQDDPSKFPNANLVSNNGLWLPSHFNLSYDDIRIVSSTVQEALL